MASRETLGIEIASKQGGEAVLRMEAKPEHLNDAGIVHGGALATLADCAMGSAREHVAYSTGTFTLVG